MSTDTAAQKIHAPWTVEQVDALNRFQYSGRWHPFTCLYGHGTLTATPEGWRCGSCDYEQDWAWSMMAPDRRQEAVARALAAYNHSRLGPALLEQIWDSYLSQARRMLDVLDALGVLLPDEGVSRAEWRISGVPGQGYPPYHHSWGGDEAGMREWIKLRHRSPADGGRDWLLGPTVWRRTVTTFPDEAVYTTGWTEETRDAT